MGKALFWIVVIFVLLLGLRLLNAHNAKRRARETGRTPETGREMGEAMVRCAKCGVFLPRTEARPVIGGFVCSDPGCGGRR